MDYDDDLRRRNTAAADTAYDDDDDDTRDNRTHKRRRSLSDEDEEDSDSDSRRRQRTSTDDDQRRAEIDDVNNPTTSKRPRPFSSANGDDGGRKTNRVCFAFQRGHCARGTQCKFAHITPPHAPQPARTPPPQPLPPSQQPAQYARSASRLVNQQTHTIQPPQPPPPQSATIMLQSGLRIAAPPLPTQQQISIAQAPVIEHHTNAYSSGSDYYSAPPTNYQQQTQYDAPQRRYDTDQQYPQQQQQQHQQQTGAHSQHLYDQVQHQPVDSYYSSQTQQTQRPSPSRDIEYAEQMYSTREPSYQEAPVQSFEPPQFIAAPQQTLPVENITYAVTPATSGRGRGSGRGHGRQIIRSHSKASLSSATTKLIVSHIPSEHNNLIKLTTHFAQFGNVIGISVKGDDSALIEYATHDEANAAYSHPKAVFDNRFIQVNWLDESTQSQPTSTPSHHGAKANGGRSALDVAKKIAHSVSPLPSPAKHAAVSALDIAQQLKQQQGISQAPSPPPSATSAAAVAKSIESLRRRQQQLADLTALFAKSESAMDESTRTMMQSKIAAIKEEIDKNNATTVATVDNNQTASSVATRGRGRGRGVLPAYRGTLRGAIRGRVSLSSRGRGRGRGHAVVALNGGQPQAHSANGNSTVLLRNVPTHLQAESALSTLYGAFGEIVSVVCPVDGDAQSARIIFAAIKSAERAVANGAIKGIKVELQNADTRRADSEETGNDDEDGDDDDADDFAILLTNENDDDGEAAVEAAAIIAAETNSLPLLDGA